LLIDVFPFADEVDLACLRIQYLSDVVDFFVISEHAISFSGIEKDLYFHRVMSRLSSHARTKIIYLENLSSGTYGTPFENDKAQKDSIGEFVVKEFGPETRMIFGDLDEIPKLESMINVVDNLKQPLMWHLAQDFYFGFFNLKETSGLLLSYAGEFRGIRKKKWLGTIISQVKILNELSLSALRDPIQKNRSKRVSEGGWHFSNCNGESLNFGERFRQKMKFSAHQEFNSEQFIEKAEHRLLTGKDPFARQFTRKFGPFFVSREPRFTVIRDSISLPAPFIWSPETQHFFA